MEGPSLFLAKEQLKPLIRQKILKVEGNTKIGKERLLNQKILDIFSWGKHLVFQFDTFALRVHFMLYGSFQASVKGEMVTGDYKKKNQAPRLVLSCKKGEIDMFSCSLRFIESADAKGSYDETISVMSPLWDPKKALEKIKLTPIREIADALLDQTIFAGVGNIIKNEVLFLQKISPFHLIGDLSAAKLSRLVKAIQPYCFQFYEWRKAFELRQHYQILPTESFVQNVSKKWTRKKTGLSNRWEFLLSKTVKN